MNLSGSENGLQTVELPKIDLDLKRMLRIQLKELVHSIEDVEFEHGRVIFPDDIQPGTDSESYNKVA